MSFRKVKGLTKVVYLPVTPSTVFAPRTLVTLTAGKLVPATAATTAPNIAGVIIGGIAATDADYATDRLVGVEVPVEKHVVYEFPTTGLVAADIGVDVDLLNAGTVDRDNDDIGIVRVTKVLTSTRGQGYVKINGSF
jgi:hypothetical protein